MMRVAPSSPAARRIPDGREGILAFQDAKTLAEVLAARAEHDADRIALRFLAPDGEPVETLDYRALDARAREIAAGLGRVAEPGDRALILLPSGPDYVASFFGCFYAGVIAVPAYPPESLRPHHVARLSGMIADAAPRLALTDAASLPAVSALCAEHGVLAADVALMRERPSPGWTPAPVRAGDVAFLQYTSGSTSAPKGVEVTHANLVDNQLIMVRGFGVRADDIVVSWLPLYHDMGLIAGLALPVFCGVPLNLMPPEQFLARPARWLQAIHRFGGTISGGPDFAFRLAVERVSDATLAGLDLSSWRVAFCGAEPVRADTMAEFAGRFAAAGFAADALHPSYGLAEATLMVSGDRRLHPYRTARVDPGELARGRVASSPLGVELVASGLPVEPGRVRIVDPETFRVCGEDEIGEVWVSGASVARGYWRNGEATAAAFLDRPDGRWLRTGDLAFMRDGYLFISGRKKDVIILRGQNRYPQDIEQAVEHGVAAVRKGRVAAFSWLRDGREGVGVAAEIGRGVRRNSTAAEIIAAIDAVVAETLQEPASLIALLEPGALPKTTSGKLQRSSCSAGVASGEIDAFEVYRRPLVEKRVEEAGEASPRSKTERRLAAIWTEALEVEAVGRFDRFLALGGHSLLAAKAAARIREEFGVAVLLRDMFAPRTLADFAAWLDAAPREEAAGLPALTRERRAPGESTPLSLAQQRLWVAQKFGGEAGAYNVVGRLELRGPLSHDALALALTALVARHEVLRTAFVEDDEGEARAFVRDARGFKLEALDLSGLALPERRAALAEAEAEQGRAPFDLSSAPLMRATLCRIGEDENDLLIALHHIVCDGWSMGVMAQDLGAFYRAALHGRPAILPPLAAQYADFALWQRKLDASGALARDEAFWRERLDGAPTALPLPTDLERPPAASFAGASVRFALSPALVGRLEALGAAHGATLYMTALAGFETLLHRWTGAADMLIGADVAGRPLPELDRLIGFFVNVLPLRARPAPDLSFEALLAATRDEAMAAFDRPMLPFDRIVEAVRAPRDRSRNPLVQVLFVLQSAPRGDFGVEGLEATLVPAPAQSSKFDMALFLEPDGAGGLSCEWAFATALFKRGTVERLARAFEQLLSEIVEAPSRALGQFSPPSLEDANMSVAPSPVSSASGARMGSKLDKLKKLSAGGPRPAAPAGLVRESTLAPGADFPLVIEPTSPDLDAPAWAAANRDLVEDRLRRHAGVLFRGFGLAGPRDFEAFAEALQPGLYGGYGDLPKKEGGQNTYRSTPYPEDKMILFHNESSHLPRWPRKQWFFCEEPAPVGGATPIVDCREMFRRLPAALAEKFERLGLAYVRTFTPRLDVDWRDFFRTSDKAEVEARCRAEGVEIAWLDGDALQTRTRCPAVIVHPLTGDTSFFNQVQLHHTRFLDGDVREDLIGMLGEDRLPRQVLWGDGSVIDDATMDLVGELYEACAVRFDWRKGDVVMLDNMLAAHARDPFQGTRRIVVAMGDMTDRADVAARAPEAFS
ncbi:MAG TPA: condensation domain-containing protein [Hansschlegelia sp.]